MLSGNGASTEDLEALELRPGFEGDAAWGRRGANIEYAGFKGEGRVTLPFGLIGVWVSRTMGSCRVPPSNDVVRDIEPELEGTLSEVGTDT